MKSIFIGVLSLMILGNSIAIGQQIPIVNDQYHLYGPNSTWGAYLQIGGNGRVTNNASVAATNGNLHLDSKEGFSTYLNYYSSGNTYINSNGGRVGIGTTNPLEKLDVAGDCRFDRIRTGNAIFYGNSRNSLNSFNTGNDPSLSIGWIAADFGGSDNNSDRLVIGTGFGNKSIIGTHNYNLTQWGGPLLINPFGGNVGIGTTNPNEKLSVNGNIRAKEIKVEATNWPDYVFRKDYQLPSLAETEMHIKEKGHLPGMPDAKEAESNGVNLGELNKKLLQKVEELTLHLIEQNKQIRKYASTTNQLNAHVNLLMNEIKTLKKKRK